MAVKSIAVFCGSKSGSEIMYEQQAAALGTLMAEKQLVLVYGGGNKGLMAAVANASLQKGGNVIGVIPKVLLEWEAQHEELTELMIVDDMHVRKKTMYELCDAAIVLPGGNGTLDELFEMLTWNNLNIHDKKIILLNTAGFYDHLVAHINMMADKGFLYGNWKERLVLCNDPAAAIAALV